MPASKNCPGRFLVGLIKNCRDNFVKLEVGGSDNYLLVLLSVCVTSHHWEEGEIDKKETQHNKTSSK